MKAITLGSDPELHIFDKQEGRVVSSLRILKKDKKDPIDLGDGIKIYSDNALAENSFPPASDPDAIMARMKEVLTRAHSFLGDRYSLLPQAVAKYGMKELDHPSLWEAGCNPNIDAYARMQNPAAKFKDDSRTGSFHIHLGHPDLAGEDGVHRKEKEVMIKLMDACIGCASIIFDKDETAAERRKLYGRAGEFRPTPYGIEYRVLGNWALRSPETTRLVWDLVTHCVTHFEMGDAEAICEAVGPIRVQNAINNHDQTLARQLLEIAAVPAKLMMRIHKDYGTPDLRTSWAI